MSLQDNIKRDVQRITTNTAEYAIPVLFTSPDSPPSTATVYATSTKHHLSIDREGAPYEGANASISVTEKQLTDANYPVRNTKGIVSLKGHIVRWTDGNGTVMNYAINSTFPDEKLGLIVCILGYSK